MSYCIFFIGEMAIISSHQPYIQFCSKFYQLTIYFAVFRHAMILNFQIIVVGKYVFEPSCCLFCFFIVTAQKMLPELRAKTTRKHNQAFAMLSKNVLVNARLVVKT